MGGGDSRTDLTPGPPVPHKAASTPSHIHSFPADAMDLHPGPDPLFAHEVFADVFPRPPSLPMYVKVDPAELARANEIARTMAVASGAPHAYVPLWPRGWPLRLEKKFRFGVLQCAIGSWLFQRVLHAPSRPRSAPHPDWCDDAVLVQAVIDLLEGLAVPETMDLCVTRDGSFAGPPLGAHATLFLACINLASKLSDRLPTAHVHPGLLVMRPDDGKAFRWGINNMHAHLMGGIWLTNEMIHYVEMWIMARLECRPFKGCFGGLPPVHVVPVVEPPPPPVAVETSTSPPRPPKRRRRPGASPSPRTSRRRVSSPGPAPGDPGPDDDIPTPQIQDRDDLPRPAPTS